MVLHTGHMATGLANRMTSGPLRILGNPLVAALIITVLAMIILFYFLGDEECLAGLDWKGRLKGGIYAYLGVASVVGLHYYALEKKFSSEFKGHAASSIVGQLHSAQGSEFTDPGHVPVHPQSEFSLDAETGLGARVGQEGFGGVVTPGNISGGVVEGPGVLPGAPGAPATLGAAQPPLAGQPPATLQLEPVMM
jgi:hypothetical protein